MKDADKANLVKAITESKASSEEKKVKRSPLRLFKKLFTTAFWLFSFIVLLNMEPVTKVVETLSRFDSFLRYVRGEDNEFEQHMDSKYIELAESLNNIKKSYFKSYNAIKEKVYIQLETGKGFCEETYVSLESLFWHHLNNLWSLKENVTSEKKT